MHLAYFVTSHGYGHGVRSAVIQNALPSDWELTVFSTLPKIFFEQELRRPFTLVPWELDCGCIQKSSLEVDVKGTLEAYAKINSRREELVGRTCELFEEHRITGVVADIPPLAFASAREYEIPSVGISNFNWVDIYAEYIPRFPTYAQLLEVIKKDYQMADAQILMYPGLSSAPWLDQIKVGVIARQGSSKRKVLAETFGLDPKKKWGLVYVGHYGMPGMQWDRLQNFEDWQFMGIYDLTGKAPSNYRQVSVGSLSYADLTASADVVLGKLGYGVVAECLSLGKPVLFMNRPDFREYPCLRDALVSNNQGIELSEERFENVNFLRELNELSQFKPQNFAKNGLDEVIRLFRHISHKKIS